jgi:hypothetical protein
MSNQPTILVIHRDYQLWGGEEVFLETVLIPALQEIPVQLAWSVDSRCSDVGAPEPDDRLHAVPRDPEELFGELHAFVPSAVRRYLVTDTPVGVFPSGGLDSGLDAPAPAGSCSISVSFPVFGVCRQGGQCL